MTYNIQGHAVLKRAKHIEQIARVIRQLRPDVVALQEVHRGTHAGASGDQLAALAEATSMRFFFGRTMEQLGGEYGNAVLVDGPSPEGTIWPLGGKGEPRALLECAVEVRDVRFTLFVAHLAAWFRIHRASRATQIERLTQVLQGAAHPFLLAGDFNTTPRAPEMRRLLESESLRIAGEHLEKSHRLSRTRLDYIFTDPTWSVMESWVIPLGPSDHWPLVADLVAPPAKA